MTKLVVTSQDCRTLGYCVAGVKEWFNRHDLDWRDFYRNGIDASILEKFDDELARNIIAAAKARVSIENG